jgi:putative Mg2+ transporter-C (MgtC) family protein
MPSQFELILFMRLLVSVILGVLIGFERTNRYKEAGIRTHAIVALGSCLLMILSKYGFQDTLDADHSRIAAQVVTGIGFLGAGMILVRKNTVSGLTTAAGIWTTSAVGMTIGAGMYFIGVSSALMIIVVQIVFHTKWFSRFDRSNDTFMVNCNVAQIREIIDYIKSLNIEIIMYRVGEMESNRVNIELVLRYPTGLNKQVLKEKMLNRLTDLDVEE